VVPQTPDSGNHFNLHLIFHLGNIFPQDMEFEEGKTVWDESSTVFAKLDLKFTLKLIISTDELVVRGRIRSDSYMKLLDEFTHLNEEFDINGCGGMVERFN